MRSRIEHFGCKGCGSTLGIKEGERVVECRDCGTKNLVLLEDHVPRYVLTPLLTLDDAKRRAMNLTREKGLARDLPAKSLFYDAGLYYLPMYEMTGMRVGKMTVTDVKKEEYAGVIKLTETKKANVIIADIYFSAPATRLGDWGIENIPLEKQRQARTLVPFDPARLEKDAVIFDPNIPPDVFDSQRSAYEGYLPGDQTRIVHKTLRVVYSPVWLIKYTYHNRLYRIVIDAVSGEILFARAPAGDADRIPAMLAVIFFFTYPISRIIRYLLTHPIRVDEMAFYAYVIGIPALLLLTLGLVAMAMAWNQFRYSGEVVWRGEIRDIERVNKPPETAIERFARIFSDLITGGLSEALKIRANKWYGI